MPLRFRVQWHAVTAEGQGDGQGDDDRPHDDKQPLLDDEGGCGCIPPFSTTRSSSSSEFVAPSNLNTATRRGGKDNGSVGGACGGGAVPTV